MQMETEIIIDGDENFRRDALDLLRELHNLNRAVPPQIRTYLARRNNALGTVENVEAWFISCYAASMCDDHLISAALSEMSFRREIALITLEMSALIVNMSRGVMPSDAFTANQVW